MANEMKQIMEKLDDIKSEFDYIKGHIVDVDTVMTDDDLQSIKQAEKEFKEGKTKRLM